MTEDDGIPARKEAHVDLVLGNDVGYAKTTGFELWEFEHNALPELDFRAIETGISFLGKPLSFPLMVTGMTGGYPRAREINDQLWRLKQIQLAQAESNVAALRAAFWPYLLLYFLFMRSVGKVSWGRILVALLTGIAYIFCWMNGVSSTSRIITHGDPIFVLVQRLHWVAMIGWAVVTVGLIMKPKGWMRVVGLVAAVTELVVGIPLAVATATQLGRFSLFALAPIACLILLVLFVWPKLWERWTGSIDS